MEVRKRQTSTAALPTSRGGDTDTPTRLCVVLGFTLSGALSVCRGGRARGREAGRGREGRWAGAGLLRASLHTLDVHVYAALPYTHTHCLQPKTSIPRLYRPKFPRKRSQQAKARGLHRTMRVLRDRPPPHDDAHCHDGRERSGTREKHRRR